MSILDAILEAKRLEVRELRGLSSPAALRSFASSLRGAQAPAIIAEVKRASPSKGVIREDLPPLAVAEAFVHAGAPCLSVLTDEPFFKGHIDYLRQIRAAFSRLPILRKDFIIDPIQVWQSVLCGADAVLLIAAALSYDELGSLFEEACRAGLEVLVELHDEEDLSSLLRLFSELAKSSQERLRDLPNRLMVGINNRDLGDFSVDISTSKKLVVALREELIASSLPLLAEELLVVSESGLKTAAQLKELSLAGIGAFLIGEQLVREGDVASNYRSLVGDFGGT